MEIEDINAALKAKEWDRAINLLLAYFPKASEEEKPTLVYNLITALINSKHPKEAQTYFNLHKDLLSEKERRELGAEIELLKPKPRTKPSKPSEETVMTEDGQVKKLGWFTSDTKLLDVIGLAAVKKKLKKRIINAITHPEEYRSFGAKISGGAILYGPPGTGKTLLGKAIAGEASGRMLLVSIPEMLNKYQGSSEKNISQVFKQAREKTPSLSLVLA